MEIIEKRYKAKQTAHKKAVTVTTLLYGFSLVIGKSQKLENKRYS
jgi:hypothetical protein